MIFYSEINSSYLSKNCVCLQDNESWRDVYVSIGTYNQCIRLAKEYEDSPEVYLNKAWGGLELAPEDGGVDKFLIRLVEALPYPLNMLMPYVNMLFETNLKLMDRYTQDPEEDITDIYGYLHVLSQLIDFEKYTMFEPKFRQEIKLSDFMYKSYQASWREYDVLKEAKVISTGASQFTNQAQAASTIQNVEEPVIKEDDNEEDSDAALHALWASILDEPDEPMPVVEASAKPKVEEPAVEQVAEAAAVDTEYKSAGYTKDLLDDMDI